MGQQLQVEISGAHPKKKADTTPCILAETGAARFALCGAIYFRIS